MIVIVLKFLWAPPFNSRAWMHRWFRVRERRGGGGARLVQSQSAMVIYSAAMCICDRRSWGMSVSATSVTHPQPTGSLGLSIPLALAYTVILRDPLCRITFTLWQNLGKGCHIARAREWNCDRGEHKNTNGPFPTISKI